MSKTMNVLLICALALVIGACTAVPIERGAFADDAEFRQHTKEQLLHKMISDAGVHHTGM